LRDADALTYTLSIIKHQESFMIRVCGVIFLLAALLLGGCNSGPRVSVSADGSEATMSKTITVLPGQTVKISTFGAVNPDCTPAGEGVYRLTQRPAQGRVDARREMVFPTFRDSNVRARCNVQRTPGTLVTYRANANAAGQDAFSYDVYSTSGALLHHDVSVNIR
jgi:hypothetical protein